MTSRRLEKHLRSLLRQWYGSKRGDAEMVHFLPETVELSSALGRVAARLIPPWEIKVAQIKEAWAEIAGAENARRCRPVSLNGGILYVEVFHPAYRIALDTPPIRRELLARIREKVGGDLCRSVKFIAGGRTEDSRR